MNNPQIKFLSDGGVWLSDATYGAIRAFCIHHGETDLPTRPEPEPEPVVEIVATKSAKKQNPPPDSTSS